MRSPVKTYFPDRRRPREEPVSESPLIVIGTLLVLLLAVFGFLALVS